MHRGIEQAQARTKRGRRAVSHRSEQKGPRQPAHAASPASRRPPTTSPVCRHPLDHICCSALHSRPCGCGCTLPERPGWVAIANRIPHAHQKSDGHAQLSKMSHAVIHMCWPPPDTIYIHIGVVLVRPKGGVRGGDGTSSGDDRCRPTLLFQLES